MKRTLWALLFVCACSTPEPEPVSPARAPVPELPEAPEPAAPVVDVPPPPPGSPVALGSIMLLAERCTLVGTTLEAADAFDAIRAVAWTDDGHVYVIDGDGALRRFTDIGDEACALIPDATFGREGVLTIAGQPEGWSPRFLALDSEHRLYVSSPLAGTVRLRGDEVDMRCETAGRLTVSPSGRDGFMLFGTGPARRVRFRAHDCSVEAWVPAEAPSILESVSFLDDERVLLGGQDGREGPHTARIYSLDGQPVGPAFGSTDASAPDRLCYAHAGFPCAAGTCILDGNCRAIVARAPDGSAVGRAELAALTGMGAPWIVPPAYVFHGMTFFGASEPVVGADGARHFSGAIFRLHGL